MYRVFSALAHGASHSIPRMILLALGLLGLTFFLAPLMFRIFTVGNAFGAAVSTVLLAFALFSDPLARFFDAAGERTAGRICLSVLAGIIAAGLLYCLTMTVLMLHAAYKKPQQTPQAMIVLGCKVNGTDPSLMLWQRIQAAYNAMQEYPEMIAVVSGGKGSNEEISEAQCMENELRRLGIPPERIVQENRSTSTSENLRFSREILDARGITGTVLIATDAYHEMRAQVLAKKEGLPDCAAVSAKTSWYLVPTYWTREWFGLAHAFVFGT